MNDFEPAIQGGLSRGAELADLSFFRLSSQAVYEQRRRGCWWDVARLLSKDLLDIGYGEVVSIDNDAAWST